MEKTDAATTNINNEPPTSLAEREEEVMNPEIRKWLAEHPSAEDTLKLTRDEKSNFIRLYYSEDFDMEKTIEEGLIRADQTLTSEIEAGKTKFPFSEALVVSLIDLAKLRAVDELIEDVGKIYAERRAEVKGLDITDNKVLEITQKYMAKLAFTVQQKLAKKIEDEAKARELPLQQVMPIVINFIMSDLSFFLDIEKFYNLRKVKEHEGEPCDLEKLKAYISESIVISKLIQEGKVAQGNLFLFPHMLSDRLFNLTGYESEQIVFHIKDLTAKGEFDDETIDLIVREAYCVESSKKECFTKFDEQMVEMEKRHQAQLEAAERARKANPGPKGQGIVEDKAIMKMMQMGLSLPGMAPPGGVRLPGMKKAPAPAKKE